MPNFFLRTLLFFSSYSPLLFILSLRTFEKFGWWSAAFAAAGLISLISLVLFLKVVRSFAHFNVRAESVAQKDSEAMAYIASYIIPFIELPGDDWKKTLGLVVFFLMIGIIYINSNMIHINPALNALGYHLLEIETEGELHSLITKKRYVKKGADLKVHKIGNGIFLEVV